MNISRRVFALDSSSSGASPHRHRHSHHRHSSRSRLSWSAGSEHEGHLADAYAYAYGTDRSQVQMSPPAHFAASAPRRRQSRGQPWQWRSASRRAAEEARHRSLAVPIGPVPARTPPSPSQSPSERSWASWGDASVGSGVGRKYSLRDTLRYYVSGESFPSQLQPQLPLPRPLFTHTAATADRKADALSSSPAATAAEAEAEAEAAHPPLHLPSLWRTDSRRSHPPSSHPPPSASLPSPSGAVLPVHALSPSPPLCTPIKSSRKPVGMSDAAAVSLLSPPSSASVATRVGVRSRAPLSDAGRARMRPVILLLGSVLLVGNYYAYDTPAAIQHALHAWMRSDHSVFQYQLV